MFKILGTHRRVCDSITRRQLLEAGGAGLFGLTVPQLLMAETHGVVNSARAKSVIFVYLFGGPSQLETFDMKPDAPSEIRGPFQPINSRTAGLRICEHLPLLAEQSDRFCVIRTLNHSQNDHNAAHIIQTGHPMPPAERGAANVDAAANDWPAIGSVVEYLDRKSSRNALRTMPSYVYLPNRHGEIQLGGRYNRLGQYAGWLGSQYNAMATRIRKRDSSDNPYYRDCTDDELSFQLRALKPIDSVTLDRLDRRRGLLEQFESSVRQFDQAHQVSQYHDDRSFAWQLLTSGRLREALDIRREPAKLRERYGRNLFGQSLVMGRRMVEAGARFVTVIWDMADKAPEGWDSHTHLTSGLRDHLLPGLDRGLSGLLEDLTQSGLIDETLVVCVGEIGRTPRFQNRGSADGRDHWSYCFPALFAGAGTRGGTLIGQSDRHAAYPLDRPISPADLACTILSALGIDPHSYIHDQLGRPVELVPDGQVIHDLLA